MPVFYSTGSATFFFKSNFEVFCGWKHFYWKQSLTSRVSTRHWPDTPYKKANLWAVICSQRSSRVLNGQPFLNVCIFCLFIAYLFPQRSEAATFFSHYNFLFEMHRHTVSQSRAELMRTDFPEEPKRQFSAKGIRGWKQDNLFFVSYFLASTQHQNLYSCLPRTVKSQISEHNKHNPQKQAFSLFIGSSY